MATKPKTNTIILKYLFLNKETKYLFIKIRIMHNIKTSTPILTLILFFNTTIKLNKGKAIKIATSVK